MSGFVLLLILIIIIHGIKKGVMLHELGKNKLIYYVFISILFRKLSANIKYVILEMVGLLTGPE